MLYVTSVIPWPINRGAAHRTDQTLRGLLAQGLSIDLICLNQSERGVSSKSIEERLRHRYPKLRRITVRQHPRLTQHWRVGTLKAKLAYFASIVKDFIGRRSGSINSAKEAPPNLAKAVRARLGLIKYDYVWFNYLRVMPLRFSTTAKVLCDLHDYQTDRVKNDVLPTLAHWRRGAYLARYMWSEKAALSRCDLAIAISPVERELLERKLAPKTKIVCVPATDDIRPTGAARGDFDLLYIGSRSDPNVAGIIWFLEECFPIIVDKVPLVRLRIQGTIINVPYLKAGTGGVSNGSNIKLSGPVEDLTEVYASAKLVICPVLYGTGMKIKMVEAMAYGKAVIPTTAAAEGINKAGGLECYDTAEEFAAACVGTLRDPQELERRERLSRIIFERDHTHQQLVHKLSDILEGL